MILSPSLKMITRICNSVRNVTMFMRPWLKDSMVLSNPSKSVGTRSLHSLSQENVRTKQCCRSYNWSCWKWNNTRLLQNVSGTSDSSILGIPGGHISPFMAQVRCKNKHVYPTLNEDDMEEMFVRGSGPGGQSVNRTANCVVLKHLPSGIVIKCHETRSLVDNQKRARRRMQEKLDWHYNGENSFLATEQRERSRNRDEKKRRSKLRLEKKKAFKEREGLD